MYATIVKHAQSTRLEMLVARKINRSPGARPLLRNHGNRRDNSTNKHGLNHNSRASRVGSCNHSLLNSKRGLNKGSLASQTGLNNLYLPPRSLSRGKQANNSDHNSNLANKHGRSNLHNNHPGLSKDNLINRTGLSNLYHHLPVARGTTKAFIKDSKEEVCIRTRYMLPLCYPCIL